MYPLLSQARDRPDTKLFSIVRGQNPLPRRITLYDADRAAEVMRVPDNALVESQRTAICDPLIPKSLQQQEPME